MSRLQSSGVPRQFSLSHESRTALSRATSALGGSGALPVVVLSDPYALLLDNWMCHMEALGIERFLVVAMDQPLMDRLSSAGVRAARCEFDGSTQDFWLQRALVWDFLAEREIDFIVSDVDALWLRNPIPEYFCASEFDILISQGVLHPVEILDRWGFVLCTGLFRAKPGAGTKTFFSALRRRSSRILETDDQFVVNFMLDEEGVVWNDAGLFAERFARSGRAFTCYDRTLPGSCESLGLKIGMLPHHLFQRATTTGGEAYVKHVQRTKDPSERISALRAAGCWLLDERPGRLGAQRG